MIENLFLVSLQASLLITFIILFRKIFKKSRKIFTYVMWLVVLIRLCIPVQIESKYGLFSLNDAYVEENGMIAPMEGEGVNSDSIIKDTNDNDVTNLFSPKPDTNNDSLIHQIQTQAPAEDLIQNGAIKEDTDNIGNVEDSISNSINSNINNNANAGNGSNNENLTEELPISQNKKINLPDVATLISIVLISGMLIVAGFTLSRVIIMRNKVRFAIRKNDNIWVTDSIDFPFVAGIFKGRIYLPAGIDDNQREYILLHEQMHIRHKDYIIRNIIAVVNIVYWWNPLIWYATYLMKQDMEMFCDEAVIRQLEKGRKKEYLNTLLLCAGQNSGIVPVMAFGESNVERRISHIMNIKKTRPYIVVALLMFAIVCFGGCVIKQDISEKGNEVNADIEDEMTEDSTLENSTSEIQTSENDTAGSFEGTTQEQETAIDGTKPISKYDMTVVNKLPYEKRETGEWFCEYTFYHKTYVSGILPGEDVRTTFVVLSKEACGSFEAVTQLAEEMKNRKSCHWEVQIVEHIKHDYKLEDGKYISQNSQETIELFDSTIEFRDLTKSYYGTEYNYYIEKNFLNVFNDNVNEKILIIDDVTLEYKGNRYIHINSSPKKEKIVSNRTGYPQYDELLDKIDYINETNPTHEGYRSIGVCYIYGYPNRYDEGGFYLIDLDNDGVEEMLLGANGQDAWYGIFYDIYTIKDGKLVQVVSGGERFTYELCKDNIIYNNCTGGASHGWNAYYTYSDGKLILKECVLYDFSYDDIDNDYFLCKTEIDASKGTPITKDQAIKINSKYEKVGFEFTNFSSIVYE